jgi:hypothetical protein
MNCIGDALCRVDSAAGRIDVQERGRRARGLCLFYAPGDIRRQSVLDHTRNGYTIDGRRLLLGFEPGCSQKSERH